MRTELRVVCANYGTSGHSTHVWPKKDLAKAKQALRDAAHHAEMMIGQEGRHWYLEEVPHRIEERTVSEWTPLEDQEVST